MKKPNVYVTRAIPESGLEMIREVCRLDVWDAETPPPHETIIEQVAGSDGLLCLLTDPIDAEVMDAAGTQLKVISNYAVGYDNIDVEAATERSILVTNTPGILTDTTADFAFALLMAAARRVVEGMDYVRAGRWKTWGPRLLTGQDVHGATLGVIGMGRIGTTVCRRARGFDMEILYVDPGCAPEKGKAVGASCVDMDTLLRESDFVTLHVPLTDETHHMIDAEALATMKPSSVLINTARGPVVDPDALYHALKEGQIAAAALDVTDPEPLPAHHRLLTLPNLIVCPHIASSSVATRSKMATTAARNLIAGLRGERPSHPVNPEVLHTD